MIDLSDRATPNGPKVTMFREEAGLPCRIVPIDVSKGEQVRPDFRAISPWIVPHTRQRQDFADFARWFAAIRARPATARALLAGQTTTVTKGA